MFYRIAKDKKQKKNLVKITKKRINLGYHVVPCIEHEIFCGIFDFTKVNCEIRDKNNSFSLKLRSSFKYKKIFHSFSHDDRNMRKLPMDLDKVCEELLFEN